MRREIRVWMCVRVRVDETARPSTAGRGVSEKQVFSSHSE